MPASNPISSLLPKDSEGPGLGPELRESLSMRQAAQDSLKSSPAPKPPVRVGNSPVDKVNPKGKYGDKPGEKRIDVGPMVRPLGSFHTGGTVPEDGAYVLKKDEKVLTPEKHSQLKAAMGLAHTALAHDEDKQPPAPKKKVKDIIVRKLHDGSFHMKHMHHPPHEMPMDDEEHSTPDMRGLKKHMDEHFGNESGAEQMQEQLTGMESK